MKAVVYRAYGGCDVLHSTELPKPKVGPGQLLLRVHASSVNPIDWKLASGHYRLLMPVRFPRVPGFDVAGEVVAVGADVSGYREGQRVHARLSDSTGAAAEYTLATPAVTAPIPEGMDDITAAGLPLAGMTALQGLRDRGGMPLSGATQRVLVLGASGGVGHLAVQIARAAGATVIGVCSARNAALVRKLGAHQVIDYGQPDPYLDLAPVDVVLDCVGQPPSQWLPRLTAAGRFVSAVPGPALFLRSALNLLSSRKVYPVMLKANSADLRVLDELAAAGKLRVVVDERVPLDELARAWRRSQSGRAVGKIIIDVAG